MFFVYSLLCLGVQEPKILLFFWKKSVKISKVRHPMVIQKMKLYYIHIIHYLKRFVDQMKTGSCKGENVRPEQITILFITKFQNHSNTNQT